MGFSDRRVPRLTCIVSEHDDLSLLAALADAGIDGFQVRAKSYDARQLIELTGAVIGAVRPAGAVVTVDDRVDVAVAAGAEGAHLGDDDVPVAVARRLAPDLLLGRTCRTRAAVEQARVDGADYAGVGPVYATASKRGLPAPIGPEGLAAASAGALPVIAIGGLAPATVCAAVRAGAHGVAVIGGIWRQPDPVQAAKELVAGLG